MDTHRETRFGIEPAADSNDKAIQLEAQAVEVENRGSEAAGEVQGSAK